ncbi:hypothetical protein [Streptomyces cyaneofuscatus]|uniref:hypothetical protein n=1 Tax=Streptomyces cyaneofuscatus TaxID=66883 RepID=UPI0034286F55
MPDSVIYRCATGGLAATLRDGLLGGYDGAGAWLLALSNLRSADEQLMVETHEGLQGDQDRDRHVCGVWLSRVLVDLPVAWHVGDGCRQGARIRMGLVPLEGTGQGDLLMAAFTVDRQPAFRFISIGGKAGVSILTEQLRRRHGGGDGGHVEIDGAFLRDDTAAFNLVLNHVFGAWHILDQDAAS